MKQIWITRIKGHISGPFSKNEILEMLENKKLSAKDEVNKSLKQWVYSKSASELYNFSSQTETDVPIIKKRRTHTKKNWMEDTVISDSPLNMEDMENTETKEETKTAQVIEQKSSEPVLKKEMDLENAEVIDYKIDTEFEDSAKTSSAQFEIIEQVRQKASIKSQKAVKYTWVSVGIIFAGVFLFYFAKKQQSNLSSTASKLPYGRRLFNQGLYTKALDVFKKSTLESDSDHLKLASMLLQLHGDTYQAQINIEKINHLSEKEQSQLQILKGIIAHKNNDLKAAESFFNQALSHSPFLGTLHKVILNIDHPEKALSILNQTDFSSDPIKKNQNVLLLLKAYLNLSNTEDHSALAELLISKQQDYKQEALLLLLYKQVLENGEGYQNTVKQVLDQDPYLTQEYKIDILSYTPRFIWKELLLDLCSNLTEKRNSRSHFIALKSLCLTQAGFSMDALKHIEEARARSPRDPLVSSVYVFISSQNNLDKHALLDHSLEQNQYTLPFILKARSCQNQEDVYCAHSHWNQVRKQNHLLLSAISGEAWSYSKMGKSEESQNLIQTGLLISNRYKPLLQLKDSL